MWFEADIEEKGACLKAEIKRIKVELQRRFEVKIEGREDGRSISFWNENYMTEEHYRMVHGVTVGKENHGGVWLAKPLTLAGEVEVKGNQIFTNDPAMCFANADYNMTDMCSAFQVEPYAGFMMSEVEDVCLCLLGHTGELMTFGVNFIAWLSESVRRLTSLDSYTLVHAALSELWYRTGIVGCLLSWFASLFIANWMSHLSYVAGEEGVTRVGRRRKARFKHRWKVQLQALLFMSCVYVGQGMQQGEETFLQRMAQMAEAAASAAQAAERAINVTLAASCSSAGASSSGAFQTGLSTASRVLRNVFDGTDPYSCVTWKFIFTSWLTFAEPQYQQLLEKVEQMDRIPSMAEYTDDEKQLSTRLFSILTSYLRGRCLQLVRSGVDARDGFRLWKEMHREYLPSSRARSLALAQALAAYPAFSKEKTVVESVLNYEQ